LLLVLEEAHAYLSDDKSFSTQAVRRVVKEGRKYGIGCMLVSQRPIEIDTTILSQCGTFFAMRLANNLDRSQVTATVPDNLEGLFSLLPILRTGEAIIVGEAVQIPMRTAIALPPCDCLPDSQDPVVHSENNKPGGWNRRRETANYIEVVELWRRQNPISLRIINLDKKR
jgi:DNA helicase HerA-like ATPase